jgi:sortase A
MRSWARPAAALLAAAGSVLLLWIGVTLVWGEPFTALHAAREQRALRGELAHREAAWRHRPASTLREQALAFRRSLRDGDPVGRITIPRLGLRSVVVQGTSSSDLAKGPGHYPSTPLPGLGGTVAIAGHRTTYLQPFRHLDALRRGDRIELDLPYGTVRYVVRSRKIVDDRDWSILRRRGYEQLVLSACHPLYSASQRIVVFARRANTVLTRA